MKKVYLHGSLGEKFGKEWTLNVRSASDAFSAINANVDGFVEYLSQRARDGVSYTITTKNINEIKPDGNCLKHFVTRNNLDMNLSSKEIHIAPMAQGSMGLFAGLTATQAFFAKLFVAIVASVVIQGILNSLFKPPKREDPTTTKSYLFQGAQNRQQQGIPVPLGYGRLRVGSAVVSTSKESFKLNNEGGEMADKKVMQSFSQFRVLELVSEGPIEGFCNANGSITNDIREAIYFNGTPVKNTALGKATALGQEGFDNLGTYNFILNEGNENVVEIAPVAKNGVEGEKAPFPEPEIAFDIGNRLVGAGPYATTAQARQRQEAVDKENAKREAIAGKGPSFSFPPGVKDEHLEGAHLLTFDGAVAMGAKIQSHAIRSDNASKVRIAFQARGQIQLDAGGNRWVTQKFAIRLNYGDRMYYIGDGPFVLSKGSSGDSYIGANFTEAANFLKVENAGTGRPIFALRGLATDTYEFDIEFEIPRGIRDYEAYIDQHAGLAEAYRKYVNSGRNGKKEQGFGIDGLSKSDWGRVHWNRHGQNEAGYIASPPPLLSNFKKNPVIQIVKLTRELDPSVKGNDYDEGAGIQKDPEDYFHSGGLNVVKEITLATVTEIMEDKFSYPHSAMMQIVFDSKNFSSTPKREYHTKLKKVLIPSNYNPISRKYDGPWNGLFKGQESADDKIYSIADEHKAWTDNPAWVFYDLVTNTRFGLGKFGVEENFVDKWALYKVAKYCDELVETGYPDDQLGNGQARAQFNTNNQLVSEATLPGAKPTEQKKGMATGGAFELNIAGLNATKFKEQFGDGDSFRGIKVAFFMSDETIEERVLLYSDAGTQKITVKGPTFLSHATTSSLQTQSSATNPKTGAISQLRYPIVEPRFTSNIYITEKMEALTLINQMAAIFRAMIVYYDGKISCVQDSLKTTAQIFNNSNVNSEGFTYNGSVKNKKFSAVVVRYNDKDDNFKPSVVYEEDQEGMEKFGYVEEEILAWGTTSRGQALRLAKWALFTAQRETETISFKAGQEASYLFPGAIFEVSDEARSGKQNSGRLLGTFIDEEYTTQPYVLLDKLLKDAPIGMVELTIAAGLARTTSKELNELAKYDKDEDDQIARIDGNHAPQLIRFEGVVSDATDHRDDSPQNQSSIVTDLRVKYEISVDVESNTFSQFNHPFQEGDLVSFVSEGSPPCPLSEFLTYKVIDTQPHSFKVAYSDSDDPVNITDLGLNEYGEEGGVHYISPEDKKLTRDALRNIMIGAPWIMKGIFAVKSPGRFTDAQLANLEVKTTTAGQKGNGGWLSTSWLGWILAPDDSGWIYSQSLGWIYTLDVANGGVGGSYWFFIPGAGWIWTNDALKKSFWYVYSHDDDQEGLATGTSAGWVYIEQGEDSKGNYTGPRRGFAYDDNYAAYSIGGEYTIGVGVSQNEKEEGSKNFASRGVYPRGLKKKVVGRSTSSPKGIWFRWNESPAAADNVPIAPSVTGTAKPSSTEFAHNTNILNVDITDVTFATSVKQGGTQVLIHSTENNALSERDFVLIRSFNSSNSTLNNLINKKWNVVKVSHLVFELIDSSSIATNSTYKSAADAVSGSDFGRFDKAAAPVNPSDRLIKPQLFRCVSVTEGQEDKYEVSGIEYDSTKFDAIDKNNIIKKPTLPIPPQEDMSLPEAPTKIFLTNLSPK